MMKSYYYFLVFGLAACAPTRFPIDCNIPVTNKTFSFQEVRESLVRDWRYLYSRNIDTCFKINDLISLDLPERLSFCEEDTVKLKEKDPVFFDVARGRPLFGIISYHDVIPFGGSSHIFSSDLININEHSNFAVYHYTENVGKAYTYDVEYITDTFLVITNGIGYSAKDTVFRNLQHIYISNR